MTTKPKGAGKALRLNLPGAPEVWHYIPGVPGLFHPVIPTPLESVGLDEEAAKVLNNDKSTHLEWADLSDDDEKYANKELAKASGDALGGASSALRHAEHSVERDRIIAAGDAAKAVTTKTDKEG